MCTLEKRGNLFFLTLTGEDEHRLNPDSIAAILSALSQANSQSTPGSVLITISTGKFFSNGFDLAWARAAASPSAAIDRLTHMTESFKPIVAAFMNLTMPTIAAVTGHAAAAGFMLAISHDRVVMRGDRGFLYMSEVDLGLIIPDYFAALIRDKISSAAARRDILLHGAKVKGDEAVRMGIVEAAFDGEKSVVEASVRIGEKLASRNWNGDVYAEIRKSLNPGICGLLGLPAKVVPSPRL